MWCVFVLRVDVVVVVDEFLVGLFRLVVAGSIVGAGVVVCVGGDSVCCVSGGSVGRIACVCVSVSMVDSIRESSIESSQLGMIGDTGSVGSVISCGGWVVRGGGWYECCGKCFV